MITQNFFGLNLFNNIYAHGTDLGIHVNLNITGDTSIFNSAYTYQQLLFIITSGNEQYNINYVLDDYYFYNEAELDFNFSEIINNYFYNNILDVVVNTSTTECKRINLIKNFTVNTYLNYLDTSNNYIEVNNLLSSVNFDVLYFDYNTNIHNDINYVKNKYTGIINLSSCLNDIYLNYGVDKNIIFYLDSIKTITIQYYDKNNTLFDTKTITIDYDDVGFYTFLLKGDYNQRTNNIIINIGSDSIYCYIRKSFQTYDSSVYVARYDTCFNSENDLVFAGKNTITKNKTNQTNISNQYTKYNTVVDLDSLNRYGYENIYNTKSIEYNKYDLFTDNFSIKNDYLDLQFKELFYSKNIKLNEYSVLDLSGYTIQISAIAGSSETFYDFTSEETAINVPDTYGVLNDGIDFRYDEEANYGSIVYDSNNPNTGLYYYTNYCFFYDIIPVSATPKNYTIRFKYKELIIDGNTSTTKLFLGFNNAYEPTNPSLVQIYYDDFINDSIDLGDGWKEYTYTSSPITIHSSTFVLGIHQQSKVVDSYYILVDKFYYNIPISSTTDLYIDPCQKLELINTYDVKVVDENYEIQKQYYDINNYYNVRFEDKNKLVKNYDIKQHN